MEFAKSKVVSLPTVKALAFLALVLPPIAVGVCTKFGRSDAVLSLPDVTRAISVYIECA